MNIVSILMIATGLAMDCFAVSIAGGVAIKSLRVGHAFRIAAFFGFFQAFMPLIGWAAGLSFRSIVSGFDHWIAFGLLAGIGIKMIYEAFEMKDVEREIDVLNIYFLLVLSFATSIDALAVGFSFSFLKISIAAPVIIIGVITFAFSFTGVFLGERFGHLFESRIEVLGGLVLIGIGTKTLLEHLGYLG